jgi:integrase
MAAKLVQTTTPGIYRRHVKDCDRKGRCDCAYVVVYDSKAQTFGTLAEAREGKRIAQRKGKLSRAHATGLHRDEPQTECPDCQQQQCDRERSEPTLHEYSLEVIERYHGTGRRGYREETRDEDRRLLQRYTLEHFPADVRLSDVGPKQIADFIGWLVKQPSNRGGTLSDSSVRNALKPLRFVLATARREGMIAHNPASEAVLPHRPRVEDDDDSPRPFPRVDAVETMELVVSLIHPDHRAMFELLAATGVRRSELLALEVRHLALDGDRPHVKVRQRLRRRRGNGLVVGPLKSRYARRDLPIPFAVADRLRPLVAGRPDHQLAFRSKVGTALDPDNLAERVLAPACAEGGVSWAGFHTFRHTAASRLFAAGRNVVTVQQWLGHHSPSFTLDTYVHLLDADLGEPLEAKPSARKAEGWGADLAPVGLRVKKRSSQRPETAATVGGALTGDLLH